MVNKDAIEQILLFFQTNKTVSAIIGSYDNRPLAKNFVSQYRNLMHHYVHQTASEKAATFWGACGVVRKDAFLKIGGFDEKYDKPSIEDIELGYRLKHAGYEIRLIKSLQIKHLKKWELKSLIMTDFFCRALPWSKLILKNKDTLNDLNVKVSNRLSVFFVCLSILFLIASPWLNSLVFLAAISIVTVVSINLPFYNFFIKNKGGIFALKVVPLHLFYYLYSGVAFSISWYDSLRRTRSLNQ